MATTLQIVNGAAWVQIAPGSCLIESRDIRDAYIFQGPQAPATTSGDDIKAVHRVNSSDPLYMLNDEPVFGLASDNDKNIELVVT